MAHPRGSLKELIARLTDRAEEVCQRLFKNGQFVEHGAAFVAGSVHDTTGDSLRVELAGAKRGRWADFAHSGHSGDLLNLIFYRHGCANYGDAARIARELLDLPRQQPAPAPVTAGTSSTQQKRGMAQKLWKARHAFRQSPAELYLARRGITVARADGFGYLPEAWHKIAVEYHPALIVKLAALDGTFAAIHRIFITRNGGPAELEKRKLALGLVHGAAARLTTEQPDTLVMTEAIEDGLALAVALPQAAIWAAPTAKHMGLMAVPACTRRIITASDNDEAGDQAHAMLCERLADRPAVEIIRFRPLEKDCNADLLDHGPAAIAERLGPLLPIP